MSLARQLLLMAALSVLLGLGARMVQKPPVPFWGFPKNLDLIKPAVPFAEAESTVSPDSAFVPADHAYKIDLSAAVSLYMRRKKLNIHFIDARDPKLYVAGRIPGAVNIPFEKIATYGDSLNQFPKTDLTVLYCDGGDCHLSNDLSEYMLGKGWKRLAVYQGGWAEWSTETDFVETTK
jgi:rhodanese-related sulfurtransferase